MKSVIALFLLFFSTIIGYSQRIVIADKQWEGMKNEYPHGNYNSKFRSSSKVIDDVVYRELMYKVEGGWFEGVKQYYREEDNKVYRLYEGDERVIFDFSLNVGDTIRISDDKGKHYNFFPVRTTDTTILNRVLRKLEMRVIPVNSQTVSSEKHVWIEGVGDTGFFFGYGEVFNNQKASPINCVKENSFFYSAGTQCNGLTANVNIFEQQKFLYNNETKKLFIKSDEVQLVQLYDISGRLVKSFSITESNKALDLQSINLPLCVIVCYSSKSYSSKIISL